MARIEFNADIIADQARGKMVFSETQGNFLSPAVATGEVFEEISRERLQMLFATWGNSSIPMSIEDHLQFFARNRLLQDFTQAWGIGFAGILMPIINSGPFNGFSSKIIAQEYSRFISGLPLPDMNYPEFFNQASSEMRAACSEKVATARLQQLMTSIQPESLPAGTTKLGWFFADANRFRTLSPAYFLLVFYGRGNENLIQAIIPPGQIFDQALKKIQPAPKQRRLDELARVDRLLRQLGD